MFLRHHDPYITPSFDVKNTIKCHSNDIYGMELVEISNGKIVAVTCSYDESIAKIDLEEGKVLERVENDAFLYSLIHWKEHQRLLCTDYNGFLSIWKYKEKLLLEKKFQFINPCTYLSHLIQLSSSVFACQSSTLFYHGGRKGEVSLWKFRLDNMKSFFEVKSDEDVISFSKKKIFPNSTHSKTGEIRCVYKSLLKENIIFFAGGDLEEDEIGEDRIRDFQIKKFDWKTEKLLLVFPQVHEAYIYVISSFLFDYETERMISCCSKRDFVIWDFDGNLIHSKFKCDARFTQVLSRDGNTLILAGIRVNSEEELMGNLFHLNLNSPSYNILDVGKFHSEAISVLRFLDEEESILVTVSHDGNLKIMEITDRPFVIQELKELKSLDSHDVANTIEIFRDSRDGSVILISAGDEGKLVVYNFDKDDIEFVCPPSGSKRICVHYVEEKNVIICSNSSGIFEMFDLVYDKRNGKRRFLNRNNVRIGGHWNIFFIIVRKWNEKEKILMVTCCGEGTINCGQVVSIQATDDNFLEFDVRVLCKMDEEVHTICFSAIDGDILYFAGGNYITGKDFSVKVYDFRSEEKVEELLESKLYGRVSSLISIIGPKQEDILIVGYVFGNISVLINKIFCWRVKIFVEYVNHLAQINKYTVLCASGAVCYSGKNVFRNRGSIHALDVSTKEIRCLTTEENEMKNCCTFIACCTDPTFLVGSCSTDGMVKIFEIRTLEEKIIEDDLKSRLIYLMEFVIEEKSIITSIDLPCFNELVIFRSILRIEKFDENQNFEDEMKDEDDDVNDDNVLTSLFNSSVLGGGRRRKRENDDEEVDKEYPKKKRKF